MTERRAWVDYAKAIGIILVVYGHVARGIFNAGIQFDEKTFRLVDSIIYSFHMPLFFTLSGIFFIKSLDKKGTRDFIFGKFDTIIYPYLVWSLIDGLLLLYFSNYTNRRTNFSEIFDLWTPRAQFWFFYALFINFVVATTVFRRRSDNKYVAFIFIISIFIYVFQNSLPKSFYINYITSYFVFFVFGILLNNFLNTKILFSKSLLSAMFVLFILSQYIFHFKLQMVFTDVGFLSLFVAIVSILFVILISIKLVRLRSKFFMLIGSASLSIYVMHTIAGSGARIILVNIFGIQSLWINVVVGMLAGVLGPLAAVYFINKFKMTFFFYMPIGRFLCDSYDKLVKNTR